MEKKLLYDKAWKQFFSIIHDFPQLWRQVGEHTSASLEPGQLCMHAQLHSVSSAFAWVPVPNKQAGEPVWIFLSVVLTAGSQHFAPLALKSLAALATLHLKWFILPNWQSPLKSTFTLAIIAGYSSCFCREVDSDSSWSTLSIYSWIKFWWLSNSWLSTVDLTTASPLISPSVVMGKIVRYLG